MTANSDKIRAVVLAALMVFSVFAGTVALSGSAAAITDGTVERTSGSSLANQTASYEVSATVEGDATSTSVGTINLTMEGANFSTADDISLQVSGASVDTSQEVTIDGDTVSVPISDDSTAGISDFTATVTGITNPASVSSFDVSADVLGTDGTSLDSGTVGTYTTNGTADGALVFAGQDVIFNPDADTDGSGDYILREGSPDDASDSTPVRTLRVGDDGLITIDTGSLDTGSYYITNDGSDSSDLEFEVIVQDFSVEFDDDTLGNLGEDANTTLEITSDNRAEPFAVNATVEDETLDDEELLTIFNASGETDVTDVDVDDDDDTDNDGIRITGVADGDEIDVSFDDIDTGEYNFTFEVVDTGVEDSASVEVTETEEGELSFNESSIEEEQGDVASINVSFSGAASQGTLVIGDYDESGYQANISVEDDNDDGYVEVEFNTYTAGLAGDDVSIVEAGDEDDIVRLRNKGDNVQNIGGLLDTTNDGYQLAVRQGGTQAFAETLDDPDELGTLFLTERNTSGINTWVASDDVLDEDDYDGLEEAEDVTAAIEDGWITESDQVAFGDVAVFQVEASGITGLFANNSSAVEFLTQSESVSLALEETQGTPNQPDRVVDLSSAQSASVVTTNSNQVFIIADTPSEGLEWQNGDQIEDDTELTANFTIMDDRLLDPDDSDDFETVETDFTHVEPDAEFDEDPITVPASEDAAITGTTNIAPQSEITVRVQSTDSEARFIKTNESVVVQEDGTFSAMFDFTDDATVGDQFEATIRAYGGDEVTADGEVVEANETDTPSNETTEPGETTAPGETTEPGETTAPGETTEPGMTTEPGETTEPAGTTTTTTPGFGAVLAVIALIGAALVAFRRD